MKNSNFVPDKKSKETPIVGVCRDLHPVVSGTETAQKLANVRSFENVKGVQSTNCKIEMAEKKSSHLDNAASLAQR